MPKISYLYCDANVFLAFFNQEAGRIEILDQLFDEVQKDSQRKIMTSVISITEVSHVAEEKKRNSPNKKTLDALDSFWGDTSLIEFVDFNELVARKARDLIRTAIDQTYTLRTNDAIHLTSAQFIGATECFTYDAKLHKFSSSIGIDVREPYVSAPKLPLIFPGDPQDP
jgi:predicted nucleic acid-binding protein